MRDRRCVCKQMVRSLVRLNGDDEVGRAPSLSSFLLLRSALLLHSPSVCVVRPTFNQDSAFSEQCSFLLLPHSSFFFAGGVLLRRIPVPQLNNRRSGGRLSSTFLVPFSLRPLVCLGSLAPIYSARSFRRDGGGCLSCLTDRPLFCHFLNGRSVGRLPR